MSLADLGVRAFVPELTPGWIGAVAALAGERVLDVSRPFRWVHLGARAGVVPAVVAASHPFAHVWAIEPDAGRAAQAGNVALAARLNQLTVKHLTDLASDVPADIDVLVLDDILGATAAPTRQQAIDLVRTHVRPGGFVVTTYRPLAGWALLQPIATLMRLAADKQPGPVIDAVPAAVALIEHLRELGAHHLAASPHVTAVLDGLDAADPEDVARTYIEPVLDPLTPRDVASALATVDCGFVGNARLPSLENVPAGLRGHVAEASIAQRELLFDLATAELFRIDVFRKGTVRAASPAIAFGDLAVVATAPAAEEPAGVSEALSVVGLEPWGEVSCRFVDCLGERRLGDQPPPIETIRTLLRSGRVRPVVPGWAKSGAVEACAALTSVLRSDVLPSGSTEVVAPAVGVLVAADASKRLARLGGVE